MLRKERAPWAAVVRLGGGGECEEDRRLACDNWPEYDAFSQADTGQDKNYHLCCSEFMAYFFIYSFRKGVVRWKKTCGANWVVLLTEGFPGMQDFSANGYLNPWL